MATQKADGSIYIKTEIDTTEAKASVKEIASLLKRLSNQVKTIGKSMEKAMSGGIKAPDAKGMDVVEEKAKTVAKELEKTAQAEKKLDNIDIKTTALDTLDKAIETTGQKLAELEKAQMDVFNRNQSATSSLAFQAMESAAAKLDQQYEELLAKKKQLEAEENNHEHSFPICDLLKEIDAAQKFEHFTSEPSAQDKYTLLMKRLGQNYFAYRESLMSRDKESLIEKAAEITAMQEAYSYLTTKFEFRDEMLDDVLALENPLKYFASPQNSILFCKINSLRKSSIVDAVH